MECNQTHDDIFDLQGLSQHLSQSYELIFIVSANVNWIFYYLCFEGNKKKTQTQNVE